MSTDYFQQFQEYCEDTLATTCNYLLAKQQNELCILLALSNLQLWELCKEEWCEYDQEMVKGSRHIIYDREEDTNFWLCKAVLQVEPSLISNITQDDLGLIQQAIAISLEPFKGVPARIVSLNVTVKRVQASSTWRQELQELLEKGQSLNQGSFIRREEQVIWWNQMRFASTEEMLIAKALEDMKQKYGDKLKLAYFPNCLVRLLVDNVKVHVYPDFLICAQGAWGILEVDGRQHNIRNQSDIDNSKRNRLAMVGIPMWSYSAEEVRQDGGAGAERVVYKFLEQLKS